MIIILELISFECVTYWGNYIKHRAFEKKYFFSYFCILLSIKNIRSMNSKDINLKNAKQNFNEIINELEQMSKSKKDFYSIEYHIFKSLINLGKTLLLYYITKVSELISY